MPEYKIHLKENETVPAKESITLVEAEYYREFHCLAADCKCDCCHGWRINIPRGDYMKIRAAKKSGALEELAETGVTRNKKAVDASWYAQMHLDEQGNCVFLNESRLCRLQMECGYQTLPFVCKVFPRTTQISKKLVENSCSPACEEVVNLLWGLPNGLNFLCEPSTKWVKGKVIYKPAADSKLYERFLEVQTLCIAILQNRAYTLDGRIILLGMALKALAEIELTTEDAPLDAWLGKYACLSMGNSFQHTLDQLPFNYKLFLFNNTTYLEGLFINEKPETRVVLGGMMEKMGFERDGINFAMETAQYAPQKELFESFLKGREFILENIIVNDFFYRTLPMSEDGVWDAYMEFCQLYSLLKYMLIWSMTETTTQDDFTKIVTVWARILLHSPSRTKMMLADFKNNGSDSLAHMAILVNG